MRWGILWFLGLLLVGGLIGYGLGAMYLPDDRSEDVAAFADNMGAVIGGLIGVAVGYYFQSSSRE